MWVALLVMSAPLRKGGRQPPSDASRAPSTLNARGAAAPPPLSSNDTARGPSPAATPSLLTADAAPVSSAAHLSRPGPTLLRRPSGLQSAALNSGVGCRGAPARAADAAAGLAHGAASPNLSPRHATVTTTTTAAAAAALRHGSPAAFGRSPNAHTRTSYGSQQPRGSSGAQSPIIPHAAAAASSPFAIAQTRATGDRASATPVTGSPSSTAPTVITLPSNMPLSGLSNHLRLSEGLSCLDYHAGFRALAIGSTRQIHVVEVIPMVGHDVAATARYMRSQQQQQEAEAAAAAATAADDNSPSSLNDVEQSHSPPASPPPPMGTAPFLMRNTGVFGGLIKVESVAWYPSTEEASLAFIQPGRTVTIFLDALQFKADGTYLPQQWTRSQYKGKTLTAAMAAGGGSTAMAVVANLDGGLAGMTPATSTTSLGERSGMYTPVSTSLAGGASFGGNSASHGGTPHEASLPMPTSSSGGGGMASATGLATSNAVAVCREKKGPAAKELIELNIDITYMRVEKIVWDPHQPYTLALSSPTTHFELWQVPTEGVFVYAPQLVLRPPAHNTRSVVRDIVFSPSNPHIIVVVTESGNTGQVLLYDRRQVEATRVFDVSGPGLSAAFHPLFSDLLAISFRREKTKPDTRIAFLRVMSSDAASATATAAKGPSATNAGAAGSTSHDAAPLSPPSGGVGGGGALRGSPVMSSAALEESATAAPGGVPASACPYLAEQGYLPPIDIYACVSRMRWRPPSLGRLTEPKRHHYMPFKASAEDLWLARHYWPSNAPGDENTTWADLLHSQLWFATAAVTTDSDLSIWDGVNGFFPVFAVKFLGTRVDTGSSNEANDFIWINELTVVSIFKSGETICTSFLNSILQRSLADSDVAERAARPRRSSGRHAHRSRSAAPPPQRSIATVEEHQHDGSRARDEYAQQHYKIREDEQLCLSLLPAYPRDPCADMFATYTVLPTSSIVSDLFGRSFTIRNSNAVLRRHYAAMLRREFGQLLRRLAIQVSREAVLRKEWAEMRYQLPTGSPSSPGGAGALAALQELRARRPRSPFTQTIGFHGHGTSSQGSDSTPPSPRRSMLTRRYSVASSMSSFSLRMGAPAGPMTVPPVSSAAGLHNNAASAAAMPAGTTAATHGTQPLSPPLRPRPSQAWSLDDVNDALLLQASQQASHGSPGGASEDHDAGRAPRMRVASGVRSSGAEPHGDGDDSLGVGGGVSGCDEETHDEHEPETVDLRVSPHPNDVSAEVLGSRRVGGGATAWIARVLGFTRHERVSRYRAAAAASASRAASMAHSTDVYGGEDEEEVVDDRAAAAAVALSGEDEVGLVCGAEAALRTSSALSNHVRAAAAAAAAAATPARRRQPSHNHQLQMNGRNHTTSPISMSLVENSESSTGSPQQPGAVAGSPEQHSDGATATTASGGVTGGEGGQSSVFLARGRAATAATSAQQQHRSNSAGARPGTSAGSSSSPLLSATLPEAGALVGAPGPSGVLYRASGGSTNHNTALVQSPPTAVSVTATPEGHKNRRSGIIFTQVFPLMKEFVSVAVESGGRAERTSRSSSAPPPTHSSGTRAHGGAGGAETPSAAQSPPCNTLSPVHTADAAVERANRKPALLLSPLQTPSSIANGTRGAPAAATTTSPLQLPVCAQESRGVLPSPVDGGTLLHPSLGRSATGQEAALSSTRRISARAFLDRQRDVTAAVESFVLCDVVCGWSYAERQREETAFVRFALEWDMGYELALTMKALRHDRADAEAAAEAAEVAFLSDVQVEEMASGGGTGAERGMRRTHSMESAGPDTPAHPRTQWRRSGSSGGSGRGASRRRRGTATPENAAHTSRSRTQHSGGGSRGVAEKARHAAPLLDWGKGAPTPTHKEVDDKVAAMMEANARTCEQMLRQQQREHRKRAAVDSARDHAGTSSATEAAASANGGSGTENGLSSPGASAAAKHSGSEASGPAAAAADDGWLKTTDPRAQWWRAAAHAWRSHHISFILAITVQQLEYASLMGDVQYCLVLYILCCLWWRLHGEVAEAAYGAAVAAVKRVKRGAEREAYWLCVAALQDGEVGDAAVRRAAGQRNYAKGCGNEAEGAATSGAGVADRRRRLLRVSTMTSVDESRHDDVSTVPHPQRTFTSSYTSPDASDGDDNVIENGMHGCCACGTATSAVVTPEQLHQLHLLRLFFRRCPFMPVLPDEQGRSASTATTATAGTANTTAASAAAAAASAHTASAYSGGGEWMERGPHGGPLSATPTASISSRLLAPTGNNNNNNGGYAGYLRISASTQSLPARSQNSSTRRLNDTPATPAMNDGLREAPGSQRASMANAPVMASSQRSSTLSPAPPQLRTEGKSAAKAGEQQAKAAAAAARANEMRLVLVNLEGLLGVRLYAQSTADLWSAADYCPPEEWKLRALQWLDTYTADLYARQLYVPLNELLLVMPEILREPTNPVQPRAADIAYEKQMTYVYCGTCSKAELWSRTQRETTPAATRLYEGVVRRGRHSSSSEADDEEDEAYNRRRGRGVRHGCAHQRGGGHLHHGADKEDEEANNEESDYSENRQRRRRQRRQRRQQHHLRRYAVEPHSSDGEAGGFQDSEGGSSSIFTPSVESPTSSSNSDDDVEAACQRERNTRAMSMNSDVSLSSEHSTHDGRASAAGNGFDSAVAAHLGEGSSHASTAGGSRASLHGSRPPPPIAIPITSAAAELSVQRRASHTPQRRHLGRGHSRHSLEDAARGELARESRDAFADMSVEGDGGESPPPSRRHTAVGCNEAGPAANNAACRRCHSRTAMTCVICEEVVEGVFFWLRSCGHGGHVHHMEEWLRYSQECPKCGTPITATWKGN